MSKAGAARKLAAAAAFGGGGLSLAGAGLFGVIVAEAKLARRKIGNARGAAPNPTGWYGVDRPGPAIRIAVLGDSAAAGYGVGQVEETTGARLAAGVSQLSGRRVFLRTVCRVGGRSSELAHQIDKALPSRPDVAVIVIGANDVTHGVLPSNSVRHLAEAVERLCAARVQVVVGTCPDLGTVRPIPEPLKSLARVWSRRLAAAQTIVVVENGGRAVSLAEILGPEFDAQPSVFFGPDQFHPSVEGYQRLAAVLIPSVLATLGLAPAEEEHPVAARGERVLPVARAAVHAASLAGTETDGTSIGGQERGAAGRWVTLMRRRRRSTEQAAPESEAPTDGADPERTEVPPG